jgi:hypothetical protein
MTDAQRGYRTVIAAASLVVGPALMSVGDLIHPAESLDTAAQIAIVMPAAARWYQAHLLLFIGFLLLVPGVLALAELAAERRPTLGYVARILMIVSVGALSAVFAFEMLLGQFIMKGADATSAVALLDTFMSPQIFAVLVPALLAFFVGTGLFVAPLVAQPGPLRWPALCFALGAALILAEIVLAKVLLSQIGNILIFISCTAFARALLRNRRSQ